MVIFCILSSHLSQYIHVPFTSEDTVITSFKPKQIREPIPKTPGQSQKTFLKFYPLELLLVPNSITHSNPKEEVR